MMEVTAEVWRDRGQCRGPRGPAGLKGSLVPPDCPPSYFLTLCSTLGRNDLVPFGDDGSLLKNFVKVTFCLGIQTSCRDNMALPSTCTQFLLF